jgi:protein-disulfide isomerase
MSEQQSSIQLKDILVPASIVVAGLLVGVGLYFGSGDSGSLGVAATAPPPAAAPADTTDKIDPITDADFVKGNRNAPVKIVEYSDFECPFCKRHHETVQQVFDKVGGENVSWVFRQFPLESLHPIKAMAVAMASECAGELGGNDGFWKFTDSYFERTLSNNRTDTEVVIPQIIKEIGINQQAFTTCFESNRHRPKIDANIADAMETGGRGTPWSIMVGPTGKTYPINGAQPASVIEQMIQTALADA